jgi:hypothetical protein
VDSLISRLRVPPPEPDWRWLNEALYVTGLFESYRGRKIVRILVPRFAAAQIEVLGMRGTAHEIPVVE